MESVCLIHPSGRSLVGGDEDLLPLVAHQRFQELPTPVFHPLLKIVEKERVKGS